MTGPGDSAATLGHNGVRWFRHGWILALLAACGVVIWHGIQSMQHYAAASALYGVAVHAPAVDPRSPTGLADGRRTVVLPADSVDGQHWIMQTQQMLAAGSWRVRETPDENAPMGRSVHWTAPYRWWLGACAWIDHTVSGRPLALAAEFGALYANPALLLVLLLVLVPSVAWRLGGRAATVLAVAMVGLPPFYVMFAADDPDHHGFVLGLLVASALGLLFGAGGWVRKDGVGIPAAWSWLPTTAQARRTFVASGVAAGLAMWVNAAGTIPALVGFGVGALAGAWWGRGAPGFVRFESSLWRRWGVAGAVTTVVAYLLEYSPAHFDWRLEVVHPLYAFAWWGGGEVLTTGTSAWAEGRFVPARTSRRRWILGAFGVAAPVIVIVVGGARVFAVSDPFLWAISHDYVPEGRGLLPALKLAGLDLAMIASCLPMLGFIGGVGWLTWRTTPPLARAVVAVPLVATAMFWLLALQELRWWGVGFAFLLVFAVAVLALVDRLVTRPGLRRAVWLTALVCVAPGIVDTARVAWRSGARVSEDVFSLVERDLAHALRQRVGSESLMVLSAPATTSRLIYFGGAQGIGTCYWENLDGMKRAAAIFAARNAEEAHTLVRTAGITHIVWLSWDDFVAPYVRLARGLAPEEPIREPAFGLELLRATVPPSWLRRLPEHLPDIPVLRGQRMLVFEVMDQTRPPQSMVAHVNDLIYRGQAAAAVPWRDELARYRDDLASQVALARLEGIWNNTGAFAAALARVEELLAQASALVPEDRVNLVILFAYGGRPAEARTQLRAALVALDEPALRRLTPGALMNLLTLSEKLECPWPDPSRRTFARSLVPPDGRP